MADGRRVVEAIVPARDRHEEIITTDSEVYGPSLEDRTLICAYRSAVPRLVAEVKELRDLVDWCDCGRPVPAGGSSTCEDCMIPVQALGPVRRRWPFKP